MQITLGLLRMEGLSYQRRRHSHSTGCMSFAETALSSDMVARPITGGAKGDLGKVGRLLSGYFERGSPIGAAARPVWPSAGVS